MDFISPESATILASRDRLLQEALRPAGPLFPVAAEYPIVLARDAASLSHCLVLDHQVVAHANLWPRHLEDPVGCRSFAVGLVGNVATAPTHRGQGLSRRMFVHLEAEARAAGLVALILWSDLLEFYQNLGFASAGREMRHYFDSAALTSITSPLNFSFANGHALDDSTLELLLALRHGVPATLARSTNEFRRMLAIPATHLVLGFRGPALMCYGIVGKGYDMCGVVHEWGAAGPMDLLALAKAATAALKLPDIVVLAPGNLGKTWCAVLRRYAHDIQTVPMALVKVLYESPALTETLARTFVWGLDSI